MWLSKKKRGTYIARKFSFFVCLFKMEEIAEFGKGKKRAKRKFPTL